MPKGGPAFPLLVRPAWALSSGCKSRREEVILIEANRNCARATECGKEAGSENCGSMNKNRVRGGAERGERAKDREAPMTKAQAA